MEAAGSRSEKCFKPAESPTEMLATQATIQDNSRLFHPLLEI